MLNKLKLIFDWSEVWAPLIPLIALRFRRSQPAYLKPVIVYLWIAFFLNLIGDIISDLKHIYLPEWLNSNNVLYNIHSIFRFICFSLFFRRTGKDFRKPIDLIVNLAAVIFLVYNFLFLEKFTDRLHLSGNLLATEAYVLLIYCMQYYLVKLKNDHDYFPRGKPFWVVTGLCIYVVINFFVFLFYVPLLTENYTLADKMWGFHNLAYITLCIFIAKAFYEPA